MISHILQAGGLMFLAGLFGLSLVNKLRDLPRFTGVLRSYFNGVHWFCRRLQLLLAMGVIAWEASIVIAVSMALLNPATAAFAGLLAAALLLVYGLGMAISLQRGHAVLDCGCSWGEGSAPVSLLLVLRNIVFAGMSLCLLVFPVHAVTFGLFEALNATAIAFLAYVFYLAADQLILNHSRNREIPR
jgi:hypothetical protein